MSFSVNTLWVDCVVCSLWADSIRVMLKSHGLFAGDSTEDTVQCIPCIATCGAGKYKNTACDGTSTVDTVTCSDCRDSCGAGR